MSSVYEVVLAESGDPELAGRVARRIHAERPLSDNQTRALQWLRDNDPTLYTGREIADLLGESSPQQVVSVFGTLVHRGHCRPIG